MRLINKIVATTALNIAAISATSANAENLLVSYAPVTDIRGSFSFNVDSNPIPLNSFTTTFATAISNGMGEFAGITTTNFYVLASAGLFGDYYGGQAFTGTTSAPMIQTGTYAATYLGDATQAGAVTLSNAAAAVPEPASWAMMILGIGAVGCAMRRRIRSRKLTSRTTCELSQAPNSRPSAMIRAASLSRVERPYAVWGPGRVVISAF